MRGGCHCGNVSVELETDHDASTLPVRRCACSFCAKHGARTATDPNGRLTIHVGDSELLIRHRFATRGADYLVCGRCGVYVAAVVVEGEAGDDRSVATLNVNTLDQAPELGAGDPVDYEGESAAARRARRLARWTPATISIG